MKSGWKVPLALAVTIACTGEAVGESNAPAPTATRGPVVPIVIVTGCASRTADPLIWNLSRAGRRRETMQAGITSTEERQLAHESLGSDTYHLVGVAEFVDAKSSASVGVRAQILSPSRVNATGMLVEGHRVAVKGLYIAGQPASINLTSVVDLNPECS